MVLGFYFNINGKLGTTLLVPYVSTIDRVSGEITLEIDPFIPIKQFTVAEKINLFCLVLKIMKYKPGFQFFKNRDSCPNSMFCLFKGFIGFRVNLL